MEKEDDIRSEMSSLSPLIPPKQEHSPPHEYFESLPERVLQRWKKEETVTPFRKVLIRRWITIAAISIGALLGGWWILHSSNTSAVTPALALSSSEAYQYVMDNIGDFENLMEHVQWPNEEKIMISDSSAVQEYLLEELQSNDIEQIF
jgi:hypothetical protein